jgi:hypothetical protein
MARYMYWAMYRALHVYVTPEQYAYLQRASAGSGWAMARYVRHALVHTYGPGLGHVDVEVAAKVGHSGVLANSFDLEAERAVHPATGTGTDPPMDAKRYAQAGLVGVRGKAGARLADAIARRTRLSADTLKTFVGAYLIVSRVRSFVKMAQRARRTRD